MSAELEPLDRIERMNDIISLYIKGETIPSIMKKTSLRRVDVLEYLEEYRQVVVNDPEIRDRARETLHNFDMHTSEIVRELWEVVEAASNAGDLKVKASALKSLAEIDKARVETLQKTGMYDDAALGDELVKIQEQADAIKELLKNVVTQYPMTKELILRGLTKIFGQPEGAPLAEEGDPQAG